MEHRVYRDNDWLSTTQCGIVANRHRRTILTWINKGWLPAKRTGPSSKAPFAVEYQELKGLLRQYPSLVGDPD